LSLDLNEEKEGASLVSFGRRSNFQIRGPADRKPREASVVLRRSSTKGGRKKIKVIVLECKREVEITGGFMQATIEYRSALGDIK